MCFIVASNARREEVVLECVAEVVSWKIRTQQNKEFIPRQRRNRASAGADVSQGKAWSLAL
jgi:hypothetical protein